MADYPVYLGTDTLFLISLPSGPASPKERAEAVSNRINELIQSRAELDSTAFEVSPYSDGYYFTYEDKILMALTDDDINHLQAEGDSLAQTYLGVFKSKVHVYASENSIITQLSQGGIFVGILVVLILIVSFLNRILNRLIDKLKSRLERFVPDIKIRNYKLLTQENSLKAAEITLKVAKIIFLLLFINIAMPLALSVFPSTKGIGETLLGYIKEPFFYLGRGLIGYIPEFVTIIVIIIVTRFVVKGLEFFANEIEGERLKISGFYPEWAKPTFNLVKVILYVFAFIVIFPYLPGSDSPAFQGVTVFLGILISLGSTSAISNIIAGLVLIYMRAFKKGDRVKIGDTVGDVIGKSMLVTRVKTIKNEEVTIPNATILTGNTINYSVENNGPGLILNTAVTIGYDVPWRKVHEMLIAAASNTRMTEKEPKPFVLQTSLDDFYVSYQLNVYTKNPKKSAVIYSELHGNIQDVFAKEGVEIMSPHYRENREGSLTIPPVHIPKPNEDKPKEKPNLPG
ncbi:mechanosensitive ion channel family protein [Algoriphagus sediminis]|uniref:Mechanosensitive ion channel family protein n=1 Tax=Algoriphagus sediminis TaxID=3057113 RepID=A0ABT7Y8U0_9BACT|nr:mechanosensitive ion channel family protein [Algoriphagus sediminis]MDN3202940.1 mechanosensitive ion channel family protein [Algoriphagus sediminis]